MIYFVLFFINALKLWIDQERCSAFCQKTNKVVIILLGTVSRLLSANGYNSELTVSNKYVYSFIYAMQLRLYYCVVIIFILLENSVYCFFPFSNKQMLWLKLGIVTSHPFRNYDRPREATLPKIHNDIINNHNDLLTSNMNHANVENVTSLLSRLSVRR